MSAVVARRLARLGSIDPASAVPLYAQLAEKLTAFIERLGEEGVGTPLPSENECIRQFGVSRPTVRQAIAELSAHGLVRSERGRGVFINGSRLQHDLTHVFENDVRAARKAVEFRVLAHGLLTPDIRLRKVFLPGRPARVYRLQRVRAVAGRVIGLEDRYVPEQFAEALSPEILGQEHIFSILGRRTGAKSIRSTNTVRADILDAATARLLKAKAGRPVLVRETVYFADGPDPIMYGIVTFMGERYEIKFGSLVQAR